MICILERFFLCTEQEITSFSFPHNWGRRGAPGAQPPQNWGQRGAPGAQLKQSSQVRIAVSLT